MESTAASGAAPAPQASDATLQEGDRRPGSKSWDWILIVDLVLIGLFALLVVIQGLMSVFGPGQSLPDDPDLIRWAMWIQNAVNLLLFAILPVSWLAATRVGGMGGVVRYLHMDRPGSGVLWGIVLWVGITVALAVLALLLSFLSPELTENPTLEGLGGVITWPLIVATALVAGVAEEIFFRGMLQKWIGVWGQAFAFGVLHASYGTLLQLVAPFALGLLFGYLVKRGMSLWAPITAHVLFDIVALSLTRYCHDNPTAALCG